MDDRYLRGVLQENLEKCQENLFIKLGERMEEELEQYRRDRSREWQIETCLAEPSLPSGEDNRFPLLPEIMPAEETMKISKGDLDWDAAGSFCCGIAFLAGDYSRTADHMEKEYHAQVHLQGEARTAVYLLKPYPYYLEEERRLEDTARQYGILNPFLYSPMSRRAVSVWLRLEEAEVGQADQIWVDLRLSENHLDQVLITGKQLFWNVEIKHSNELSSPEDCVPRVIPGEKDYLRKYRFPVNGEQEYIHVYGKSADVCIKRSQRNSAVEICMNDPIGLVDYEKLILHSPSAGKDWTFVNTIREWRDLPRIRTRADIAFVTEKYGIAGSHYLGVAAESQIGPDGQYASVYVYKQRHQYHYPAEDCLKGNLRGNRCYLIFQKQDGDWLFEDKISYLTAYLHFRYPEFFWVPVVKREA